MAWNTIEPTKTLEQDIKELYGDDESRASINQKQASEPEQHLGRTA